MKGNKNDGLFVNAKIHNTEVHCEQVLVLEGGTCGNLVVSVSLSTFWYLRKGFFLPL
jgi:hypothetical protein